LLLTSDVTIDGDVDGDDVADITVSGGNASQVFSVENGTSTLHALTVADGGGFTGGGVYVYNGAAVTLTNSTIRDSTAYFGGGIFVRPGGTATLIDSTISGNTATIHGGGIYIRSGGTTTLTNSTLSGNEATNYGGGIANLGSATLTNTTISGNSALGLSGDGGGIHNSGTAALTNSIVLGNSATSDAEVSGAISSATSLTSGIAADVFAQIDGGTGGGLLADNGGSVQTIALNSDVTNPALDAGDDSAAPATDATGNIRFDALTIANNGANISDLGAVELVVEAPGLHVTIATDVVDLTDGETSLREALAFANSNADASTITFDAALSAQTITLGGTELVLSTDVTIDGDIDGDDIADITISGNDVSRVINATAGSSALHALTIADGEAGTGNGGGLHISYGATVDVTNSTISGGSASFGGAVHNAGTVTLTNSTLSGNSADNRGGGIYNNFGTATLTNTTLSDNSTFVGGAISNRGVAELTNSTLSGNTATIKGGGIYTGTGSTTTLTNSIVLGNSAGAAGSEEVSNDIGSFNATTSLTGAGSETAAAVFAALDGTGGGLLADNGGPVQTIALNSTLTNPALDAGDDGAAPAADASGAGRGDAPVSNNGANISDLGALELQETASLIVTTTSDVVDAYDYQTSLREA
ncbi:beta strand repeat-containing protein, partial [Phaeobacter marinintestinus]|uniref:beta strand repeat-containing protein n=1 Tax=Falsiphaeobacter marinintestinus TaxID=1492905 RepID=UPI001646AA1B